MTQTLFEIRGLEKAFGDNVLFSGADLDVYEGETLAIIGESGSGKSIFLKMLIGLIEPDAGTILYKGRNIAEFDQAALDKLHREVGYVFQNDAMFDSMTVVENVGYALRDKTDEEIRAIAEKLVVRVGLEVADLDKFPAALSGGMRKRAALARAIAVQPEIILYDEPTQGLDPQNITRIALMIEQLQSELKVTSVVVTHDMRTAFGVSNRIVMLHEGKFPFQGTPEELVDTREGPVHEFIDDAREELHALFSSQ